MSLNLNKHGAAMQEAWKEVRNEKIDTNWALFGYEGNTFDLKLISKGEDGVEELKEDLNASKIMYGFIRVDDPKTSLPKFVFLHWQGESVPGTRKGLAATHFRDVEKYFYGACVTINARNDDEVEEEDIIAKVSKTSASAYNFKEKQTIEAPQGPVGTHHKKINPKAELPNLDQREKFWNSEENREKERLFKEKERKKSEAQQIEAERRAREERETAAREAAIKEREKKISQIKASEAKAEAALTENSNSKWEAQQAEDLKDMEDRNKRAEELRRQRSEEAKQLIGQRSHEARAVFERNSSMGQMNFRKPSNAFNNGTTNDAPPTSDLAPVTSGTSSVAAKIDETPPKEENANEVSTEDIVVPPPESFGNDDNAEAQQNNVNNIPQPPDVTGATASHQPDLIQDVAAKQAPDVASSAIATEDSPVNGTSEFGVCAMALYDYQAADETEISFDPGQLITHIDQIDPGWWQGLGPDGNYGLFPANYVEVVDSSTIRKH